MAALAEAFVRIRPDTSTFKSEAEKGVASAGAGIKRAADRHGKLFGTAFVKSTAGPLRGIAGVIGGPVAAAFAVIGGAKLFSGFIAEGREAQKVGAQTAAVLKSTGGVAKISASQVGDLATAISNKVGVDDEAIQSGANLLLTFTNIRNEAGKGNRIFDQATQVVTDMAAAMNQGEVTTSGLKTASIQVGKALQDPIKGVTALRKVGVSLTDQQTKQIKTMVESGDTLGAQKIILGELNREFGGSAAAGTNAMEKLGVVFGNIKEQIGTALLPIIDGVASWLAQRLPGAVKVASKWLATAKVGFQALVDAFKEGDVTSDGFIGVMERIGVAARAVFEYFKAAVLPRLIEFGGFIKDTAIPALVDFGGWLVKNRAWLIPIAAAIGAIVAAIKVWTAVSKVFAAVQAIVNAVLAANPIGIVVLALVALVAAFVTAYKTSDTFRGIVQKAWAGIQVAISFAWNNIIKPVLSALSGFIRTVLAPTVSWLWRNVVVPAFNGIKGIIQVVWPIVRGILQTWWAFIRNVLAPIITWLWRTIVVPVFNGIKDTIKTVWDRGIKPVLTAVGNFIRDKVAPAFSTGVSAVGRAWDRLKSLATTPVNFVIGTVLNKGIFAAYNWVVRKFGGTQIPNLPLIGEGGGGGGGGGRPLRLARGMRLPGYGGGDRVPVLAEAGEAVIPKHLVPEIAPWAKSRGIPGFADGGVIGRGAAAGIGTAIGAFSGTRDPLRILQDRIVGALRRIGGSDFARTIAGIPRKIGSILVEKVKAMFTGGGAFPGVGAAGPVNVSGNAALGRALAQMLYGWTGGQWGALFNLWQGESGWNNNAQNPTSTAYGIPQFLNSTWASVGIGKTSDPRLQIIAGLRYIAARYGSPAAAYGAWLSRSPHWYGSGLPPTVFSRPTLIGVGERGPETVSVTPKGSGGQGEPVELSAKTIRALGETMGQVVLRGLSAGNVAVGRTADLYVRGG